MADIFSKKKRSEIVSQIRSKNTSVEKEVFKRLRQEGIYYEVILPRSSVAIG